MPRGGAECAWHSILLAESQEWHLQPGKINTQCNMYAVYIQPTECISYIKYIEFALGISFQK